MGSLQSNKFTKVTVVAGNSGPSAHTPAMQDLHSLSKVIYYIDLKSKRYQNKTQFDMESLQSNNFTKVTMVAGNSGPSAAAHTPAMADAEAARDLR